MTPDPGSAPLSSRPLLRQRLLGARAEFMESVEALSAQAALVRHLRQVLADLEPACLGCYCAIRSEFSANAVFAAGSLDVAPALALPFVQRQPAQMHYRHWDGRTPTLVDEARIPATAGAQVVPDVVLVPCVGFTAQGYRLGYGGGYFDRWMAANPQACTIGVAWSGSELTATQFEPEPHDQPLTLVLTERGVLAPR